MNKKTSRDYEMVDKTLEKLYHVQPKGIVLDKYLKSAFKANSRDIKIIRSILNTEDLAKRSRVTSVGYYVITTKGIQVYESGGYLEYIKRKKKIKQEEKARDRLEDQKLIYETKLAKWQVKLFWPITITGFIMTVIAIIEFFLLIKK